MKKINYYLFLLIAFLAMSLGACKKEDLVSKKEQLVDNTAEFKEQTDDQLLISAEIDAVTIDANTAVESTEYFFERRSSTNQICDGTFIVGSTASSKLITITYSGTNCAGKTKREGQVVISMQKNKKWSDAGTVLVITYNDLHITRTSDNKTIVLNGELTLTNESGGRLSEVYMKNIVHTIYSNKMDITFADGIKRSWQLSVKRTFSLDNGLVITSTGNRNNGSKDGISASGTTHAGVEFVTFIAEPMIIRQDCYFRIVSAKLIQEQGETLDIIFGLNEKGEPVSCPSGSYYLQVSAGAGSATKPFLLPY